jgi:hypothetical protein
MIRVMIRTMPSCLRKAVRSRSLSACLVSASLAIAVAVGAPVSAHAENCAWLNAATAGGILSVEASVKIEPIVEHLTPGQVSARQISGARPDAICTFASEKGPSGPQLQIAVHTMTDIHAEFPHFTAACGKDATSLRAVGNEAIECSEKDENHNRIEKVISRVRDRAFLLTWTIPGPENGPNAMTQDAIREKMRNLAEQVAGSLF